MLADQNVLFLVRSIKLQAQMSNLFTQKLQVTVIFRVVVLSLIHI